MQTFIVLQFFSHFLEHYSKFCNSSLFPSQLNHIAPNKFQNLKQFMNMKWKLNTNTCLKLKNLIFKMVEIIQKMVGDYSAAKIVSKKIMNLPSQYNMTRKKYGRVTVKLSYKNWFIHCPKIIFLLFIIFMAWASKFFSFICRILSGLSLKKYTSQYSILSILLSCITSHYYTICEDKIGKIIHF